MSFPDSLAGRIGLFLAVILFTSLAIAIINYRAIISDLLYYQYWRIFSADEFISGTVDRDGVSLYYEVYGQGKPLVLLHGGLSSLDVFFAQLPKFSKQYRVIAIDLRGQGRSTLGSEPFTYRLLTGDVIAVLDELNIAKADFVGWSDGGIIGLRLGLEYPSRVNSLVAIGANFRPDGVTRDMRRLLINSDSSDADFFTRLMYWLRSPHPELWDELWHRVTTMWLTRPDMSKADLNAISVSTLLVFGEHDNVDVEHSREMAAALPNSSMVIVDGAGHNLLLERPEQMFDIIQGFLTKPDLTTSAGDK